MAVDSRDPNNMQFFVTEDIERGALRRFTPSYRNKQFAIELCSTNDISVDIPETRSPGSPIHESLGIQDMTVAGGAAFFHNTTQHDIVAASCSCPVTFE